MRQLHERLGERLIAGRDGARDGSQHDRAGVGEPPFRGLQVIGPARRPEGVALGGQDLALGLLALLAMLRRLCRCLEGDLGGRVASGLAQDAAP